MNNTAFEAIIDVAIGMIFMWLIISVATMAVQEWIASYLKWRANDLETAIRRLLGNNQLWVEQLYAHPLIQALSKKYGVKPSYIPANKFALALGDVVFTAGTEQSFIQQQLLAARQEIERAPDQFIPLMGYLFQRFGSFIVGPFRQLSYFFGSKRGTPQLKLEELLSLTQKLFQTSHSAELGELQEKLKEFFLVTINDHITLPSGKELLLSSADFLDTYPGFRRSIFSLLNIALQNQPQLKLRWAEILVNNDPKLIAKAEKELKEGQTLREKLHEMVVGKAKDLDLSQENTDLIVKTIRQTLEEIDFMPVVNHIQDLIGTAQGMEALQDQNPTLYKSLTQLGEDLIGVANTPKVLVAVRERFAIAAENLEKEEYKLYTMRINTEIWFNESMDRLSGWYKRKATLLAFIIGLVLGTIMNVDSVQLAQHLWKEPAVRNALVANATEFTQENSTVPTVSIEGNDIKSAVDYFNVQFEDLNIPLGWVYESVELMPGQICRLWPFGQNLVWGFKDSNNSGQCLRISNAPTNTTELNLKILGILLTGFAAAQGSPFWFDILKKVVNIRGSGPNPDEKSK